MQSLELLAVCVGALQVAVFALLCRADPGSDG